MAHGSHDAEHVTRPGAMLQRLADGFGFTEGPVWDPRHQRLLFSDIPASRMFTWTAEDGITLYREPSNMANGNVYDREGRLLTCEHASSSVTRTNEDGEIETLASHYEGKQLNSPNDIVVSRNGTIYFTDPEYGRRLPYGVDRPSELAFRGVYRLVPGEDPVLLVDDFDQPNGLCLSLDESRLFVNDTERGHVRMFTVEDDGHVSGGDVWAELPADPADATGSKPDGMKVNSEDQLFCTGPFGIHVFDDRAAKIGFLELPERAANFNWGGADLRTLYLTATTSIYAIEVLVPGQEPF